MWRKGGGCGGRVVDVEGEWWMWRKGVCERRMDEGEGCWMVDVEEGWMWREDGCGGRVMDVAIHTSHGSLVTHAKNNVQPLTTKRIGSGHLC